MTNLFKSSHCEIHRPECEQGQGEDTHHYHEEEHV